MLGVAYGCVCGGGRWESQDVYVVLGQGCRE